MPSPPPTRAEDDTARPRSRSRSRSPRRSPPRKPKNYSGLKWKDTKREERGGDDRRRDDRRGDRSDRRDRERRDDRDRGDRRRDDRGSDRRGDERRKDDRRDERRDPERRRDDRDRDRERKPREPREPKEKKAQPPAPTSGEAYIIVTVNDRLGTKTQVPCMPSDPVKVLKAMVAAKIGRPVHEIMLKRQGERPFLDSLSLADYSISNGVQIDLELNTGD